MWSGRGREGGLALNILLFYCVNLQWRGNEIQLKETNELPPARYDKKWPSAAGILVVSQ